METSVATLLHHLDPDVDVVVLGVDAGVTEWIARHHPNGNAVVIPPVRNKRDVRGILGHISTVRSLRADILQVDLRTPWSGIYATSAGLLAPGTSVITVDHTAVTPHNRQVIWAKRIFSALASANVAVSHGLARFVEDAASLRRGRVRAIYNGIADLGPPSPRQRHDPPVVGTIARLVEQKGIDILLQAMTRIPRARCVIVGDGKERVRLERLAAQLGLSQRVTWTGWRDDSRDLLPGFDVFVLPSRWEGLGRVLVEAALAECPAVTADVPGTSEVIEDGETGLLVPPEDPPALASAIRTLLDDEDRAREMARRARTFALSRFDPVACARAYESLYEDVAPEKGRVRAR
jgi:glycosyltransferase involved in cell wall biosynthesis